MIKDYVLTFVFDKAGGRVSHRFWNWIQLSLKVGQEWMHEEEEEWYNLGCGIPVGAEGAAVHKAALQPSQECKLQEWSNRGCIAGEGTIQSWGMLLPSWLSVCLDQSSFQFSDFSFQFARRGWYKAQECCCFLAEPSTGICLPVQWQCLFCSLENYFWKKCSIKNGLFLSYKIDKGLRGEGGLVETHSF